MGFRRTGKREDDGGARRRVFLSHDGLGTTLALCEHRSTSWEPFDETRTGLDNISFSVATHAELESWRGRLLQNGVSCSAATPSRGVDRALVLVFRDPDNIQLELFAKSG